MSENLAQPANTAKPITINTSNLLEWVKKRADFLTIGKTNNKVVMPGFILLAKKNKQTDVIRVGLTVSRKVGCAVVRNHAKRRLRSLVRDYFSKIAATGNDYIFIGRTATPSRPYCDLINDVEKATKRINHIATQ